MSSGHGSKFWGMAAMLGLTGMGLLFLFAVMEDSRNINNPTPAIVGVAAAAIFFALWRGPVGRAIGKMLEGDGIADDQVSLRVEQLEDRLAELSNDQLHVAELEERLDFAERLLSQRQPQDALPNRSDHGRS